MRRLAVIGHPVAHSRSPAIQNAALRELGMAAEWSYEAIDVAPAELEARLRAMPAEGFAGANVTVPHKEAALALADVPSEVSRQIGAANVLVFDGSQIRAENTDAEGLLASLPEPPAGLRALLLGAGGAARAVAWALVTGGAEVSVWNRTPARAEALAAEFGITAMTEPLGPPGGEPLLASTFSLIVNATGAGMLDGGSQLDALPLDPGSLGDRQIVVDLAYGEGDTELVRAARAGGARVVDGLEILVRQAAASLRIWTGADAPLEAMMRAARL